MLELYCVRSRNQHCIKNIVERSGQQASEQHVAGEARSIPAQQHQFGNFKCLPSVYVGDIKGNAARDVADPVLVYLNHKVGRCKPDCGSFLHTGMQHEHSPGFVFTHQYFHVDSGTPINSQMFADQEGDALCDEMLHGAYRPVPGVVARIVLTRAELAAYVQALQRRAHAFRTQGCQKA